MAARQGDSGPGSHMVHFVGLPVASGQYLGGSLDCFFVFYFPKYSLLPSLEVTRGQGTHNGTQCGERL